jgi:hypothetical protein
MKLWPSVLGLLAVGVVLWLVLRYLTKKYGP